jgi:hypothetical protein
LRERKSFIRLRPGRAIQFSALLLNNKVASSEANVVKLFTAVIYHQSIVILSFRAVKLHYLGIFMEWQ